MKPIVILALASCGSPPQSARPDAHVASHPDAAQPHPDAAQPHPDAQQPVKRVFLASPLTGNLNGPTGADAVCMQHAAGLPGTFRAWLSGDNADATARMTHSAIPYALVNGEIVADDWADLIDGTLATPIDLDEHGDTTTATIVWTATSFDGTGNQLGANCNDWSFVFDDSIPVGAVGDPHLASPEWTSTGQLVDCLTPASVYCIEQ